MSKVENAWRIHDAQADWTGKVDNKAAFALSVQSLLLTGAVALAGSLERGIEFAFFGIAIGALVVGVIFSALVVAPRLRMRDARSASASNFIYFGHARHWSPDELEDYLDEKHMLKQVNRQIVVMARIAWAKHIRVAWSIWLGIAGGLSLLVAAVLVALR